MLHQPLDLKLHVKWPGCGGFLCTTWTQKSSESSGIKTKENLFSGLFPLKLCTRMLFCNKNGWRRVRGISFSNRECPVLWVFALAHVSPCQASSSFFFPLFLSSSHPLRLSKFLCALLLHRILCRQLIFQSGHVKSAWLRWCARVFLEELLQLRFFQSLPGTIWVLN